MPASDAIPASPGISVVNQDPAFNVGDERGVPQAAGEHVIPDGVSTLVFRNLPRRLSPNELLRFLDVLVPTATYNFVLMPVDGQRGVNLCQCIVNFVTPEAAQEVALALQNFYLPGGDVKKRCKVLVAALQGLELNLAVCALNLCFGEDCPERRMQMPLVFDSQRRPADLEAAMRKACQGEILKQAWLIHTSKHGKPSLRRHESPHEDSEKATFFEHRSLSQSMQRAGANDCSNPFNRSCTPQALSSWSYEVRQLAPDGAAIPFPAFRGKRSSPIDSGLAETWPGCHRVQHAHSVAQD